MGLMGLSGRIDGRIDLVVVLFMTGLSDEFMAGVVLVRVVMALATVIAWAAVVLFWQVRLIGIM